MAFPSLLPAIGLLQAAGALQLSAWVPAPGTGAGLGNGTWAAPVLVPQPYTVEEPTGARALIQLAGGEVVQADIVAYCRATVVSEPGPGGRWPRVFWQGKRYRVLGRRGDSGLPSSGAHIGLVCAREGLSFEDALALERAERALRDPCPNGGIHEWKPYDCGCHMWQSCGTCKSLSLIHI